MKQYLKDIDNFIEEQIKVRVVNEIVRDAPRVIHQAFSIEFANLAQANPKAIISDLPRGKQILDAISLLEEIYPSVKIKPQ